MKQPAPQTLFSFWWHPFAVEEGVDYDKETPTLVEFTIEDRAPGILLRVVESGFDTVPEKRRQKAFKMNSRGWDEQMGNIETWRGNLEAAQRSFSIALGFDPLNTDARAGYAITLARLEQLLPAPA